MTKEKEPPLPPAAEHGFFPGGFEISHWTRWVPVPPLPPLASGEDHGRISKTESGKVRKLRCVICLGVWGILAGTEPVSKFISYSRFPIGGTKDDRVPLASDSLPSHGLLQTMYLSWNTRRAF